MKINWHNLTRQVARITAVAVVTVTLLAPMSASAAASADVKKAQEILYKFGYPVGTIDGIFGPVTARSFCMFRQMSGMTVNRNGLTSDLLTKLKAYDGKYSSLGKIPAPNREGKNTYLLAQQTCQAMFYVEKGYYKRVIPISTGMADHTTPNGNYSLGGTQRGWSCSTEYQNGCTRHTEGRFVNISNYGNMYNKRLFKPNPSGNYLVHGSTSVPTYPASHGCIRVPIAYSDWMYDNVGNDGPPLLAVIGKY